MHEFAVFRCAVLVCLASAGATSAQAEPCPTLGAAPAVLVSVAPRLDLKLADGRVLRLAGLETASGGSGTSDRAAGDAAAFASLVGHRPIGVTMLSPKPDRWGRYLAFASIADGPAGGLAAAALAAGLARYRPEAAAAPCRTALLAAEDGARRARLGLWADPFYSVLRADDRAAFAGRAGTDIVVEARLRAVEPGPYRTRLLLDGSDNTQGSPRGRLEATIVPHVMKTFEANGVDVHSLIGRNLRLRGLLDRRFGPRIELASPDEIEVLPEGAASARSN